MACGGPLSRQTAATPTVEHYYDLLNIVTYIVVASKGE